MSMTLKEAEAKVRALEVEILKLEDMADDDLDLTQSRQALEKKRQELLEEAYKHLSAYDHVYLARKANRPNIHEYIDSLFDNFMEMHGDRLYGDDGAVLGGVAFFEGQPVTVIGHVKGKNLSENLKCNFGMPQPEGYRKALRLMKQAEKFGRPIITFIDTPGAYPGIEAEEHGQGEAIARSLLEMSQLKVPVIAIVIGEGGSGGALALAVADRVLMLEHAVYSVLSPEGFASILWKDSARSADAAKLMHLTAHDLYQGGVVEEVLPEPPGGAQTDWEATFRTVDAALWRELGPLLKLSGQKLAESRYRRFQKLGQARKEQL